MSESPVSSNDEFSSSEVRLIRGTYAILASRGAQQTSLREIARDLGVSPSLLVYHFGTYENLLISTMRFILSENVERISRPLEWASDVSTAVSKFLDRTFAEPQRNLDHFLVYLDAVQYGVRHPAFTGVNEQWRPQWFAAFDALLKRGVEAGVIDISDTMATAKRARAILDGLYLTWIQEPDREARFDDLRRECQSLWVMLIEHDSRSGKPKTKTRPRRR